MPGGKGNIRPEDGQQFKKGNKAAEKWTEEKAIFFAQKMVKWLKSEDENIFFDDFIFLSCNENDFLPAKITADTPSYLNKKFSSFSELYEKARKIQEIKLKKFGAFDKLNVRLVTFLLSAEHGISEKTESKITIEKPIFTGIDLDV